MPLTGRVALALGGALALAAWQEAPGATPPKSEHAYVGPSKCALCHKAAVRGDQYGLWVNSKHAGAWRTLATDASRKLAASRGIADPTKAPQCLRCHVTGHGTPPEDGITCEACHGPGGDYAVMSVMRDLPRAQAAGLILAGEQGCLRCHNAESPTFKGFDYTSAFAAIAHPDPLRTTR